MNDKLRQELGELNTKIQERLALEAMTAEQMEELETWLTAANEIKIRAAKMDKLAQNAAQLNEMFDTTGQRIEVGLDAERKGLPLRGWRNTQGMGFKEWDGYLTAIWYANHPRLRMADARLRLLKDAEENAATQEAISKLQLPAEELKQLVETIGGSGGYLVPMEFLNQLYSAIGETAIVRPLANIIRMTRRQISVPVLDQTGATAGTFPWFGGMLFYWESEATEKTLTEAAFRQATLTAYKLIGYTRASDELVTDSIISLADFFSGPTGLAGGIAAHEDYAFLRGTGVGQPLGVVHTNCNVTLAQNRASANQIDFRDFARMSEKFIPGPNSTWVLNQSLFSEAILLQGPTSNPSYVWVDNARDGVPGRLLGLPVRWTEKLPAKGSRGDVLLANFSYYLLGDRQATTIESTQYDKWALDQTSWRAVHRVGGRPWLSSPITLVDGSTQISPFVVLDSTVGS